MFLLSFQGMHPPTDEFPERAVTEYSGTALVIGRRLMNQDTIFALRRLFLDVRMLYGEGKVPPDARFTDVLALLDKSRAGDWMSYCCENLRSLVRSDRDIAYDFADAVHNSVRLEGLEDGLLLWTTSQWESEIEPFRERYGQAFFSDFTDCILPDEGIDRQCPDMDNAL